MKVKYIRLSPNAQLPCKSTAGAAAYDLYANEDAFIPVGEIVSIGTGISMEIPEGWKGEVYSRSGLSYKGVVVANSPGKIDSDYRGEITVLLHNVRQREMVGIKAGDRIAQFEINPVHDIEFEEAPELTESERGEGGFGSTGT